MNGAELPCGSILQVEPSDSSYGQNSSRYAPQSQPQPTTGKKNQNVKDEKEQPAGEEGDKKDNDSDLDDFFESLA